MIFETLGYKSNCAHVFIDNAICTNDIHGCVLFIGMVLLVNIGLFLHDDLSLSNDFVPGNILRHEYAIMISILWVIIVLKWHIHMYKRETEWLSRKKNLLNDYEFPKYIVSIASLNQKKWGKC